MKTAVFWFLIMTASFIKYATSQSLDWTKECSNCTCIWVSGKRTANCSNKQFTKIPTGLSTTIREIDFSGNSLYSLDDQEFVIANLVDIHRLRFQNCSIEIVDEGAFKRLGLIIELDLSRNSIVDLHKNTFKDNVKLRILILSYNRIQILEDGLFHNLSSIQRIHLDHNRIEAINEHTFSDLNTLTDISLGFNQLKTIEFDLKKQLPKLNSLNIEENPWICDCKLEPFHRSILTNNLITHDTKCAEPLKLKGRLWTDRSSFPCAPVILTPLPNTQIEATGNNVTLTCQVLGDPEPNVEWTNNGFVVNRDPRKGKQKYFTSKRKIGEHTWNNLTIVNLNYKDKGEYKCVARNSGGEDLKAISLFIEGDMYGGGSMSNLGTSSVLVIGLTVGLIILLIIIVVLAWLYCRKYKGFKRDSQENANSKEMLEIKEGLMTDVNPICKPPRASVPASVVSGGTEVSDAKRNLLDNESVFDIDDESRLLDFDQPSLQKTQTTFVEPDYKNQTGPYPPDLLSFPSRLQISPAGSNASTIVMDARLPPHHGPQSPLHNPIYDQLSIYRTLPYSRSHSPFTQGMSIPKLPRQGVGYVTIPRRPRQSWSSEPPPSSEVIGEPLYDNLGVRSTVDGSCVSINKIGAEPSPSMTSTPRSNRMFPLTPSAVIDPIVESHEFHSDKLSPPRPLPAPRQLQMPQMKPQPPQKPMVSQTLPRNMNSAKLTPAKSLWSPGDNKLQENRNSITSNSIVPISEEEKPKKIPPRPPPKPKKRVSAGPQFEDEGEDGTEV